MSMRAVNQNNVLAGAFVIAGILLAVGMSFVLGDLAGKFGEKSTYKVRFPTSVGVVGLEPGAEVSFAGLSVGTVTSVGIYYPENADGAAPTSMEVEMVLQSDLVLYEDAIADLSPPILGGVSRINIASAGSGPLAAELEQASWSNANGVLEEGEVLMGRFAPSILTQVGLGPEEVEIIKGFIANFPEWSAKVDGISEDVKEVTASARRMMVDELEPEFGKGVADGRSTMENIRNFTDRLSAEGGWGDRVDSIMTSVDTGAAKFETTLDDANATMASARELLDDNSGKIGRILDNVEVSTERVKLETIDKMNDLLAQGTLAVGSAQDTIEEVNGIVVENRSRVASTMVNVQQLSLGGKLMVEELRSQPWRILSKPSKSDLRREPLYEAARSYSLAVSELKSASESLDTAVRLAGGKGSDPSMTTDELTDELRRLAAVVEQAYGRYEFAERGLLELLAESP